MIGLVAGRAKRNRDLNALAGLVVKAMFLSTEFENLSALDQFRYGGAAVITEPICESGFEIGQIHSFLKVALTLTHILPKPHSTYSIISRWC
jgi:hypothetical protein